MSVDTRTEEEILNDEFGDLDALIAEADAELKGLSEDIEEEPEEIEDIGDDKDEIKEDDIEEKDDAEDESQDNNDDLDSDNEDEDGEEDNISEFTPMETEIGGHKITINSKEELEALIKKGAESFNQEPDTLTTEKAIIEQGKVTAEDLKLLVDAKNGDVNAIAKLAQQAKVDTIDIPDNGDEYKPTFEPTVPTEVDIVARNIMADTNLHAEFTKVTSGLPQDFIKNISSNAKDLATFGQQVKDGLAQEIIPEAMKLSLMGMDFTQAYVQAGTKILKAKSESTETNQKQERQVSDKEKQLRKQAKEQTSTKTSTKKTGEDMSEDDVWNLSDEDFHNMVDSQSK